MEKLPNWKLRQYVEKRLGLRINLTFQITEAELLLLRRAYTLYEAALYRDYLYYRQNLFESPPSVEERLATLFPSDPPRKTKWKRWRDSDGNWHFELR